MKYVAAALMILLAGAAVLLPAPAAEEHDSNPATELPPVSICPIRAGSGISTEISVISSADVEGKVTAFASSEEIGSLDFQTSETGSVTIDAAETGALADAGGLIEIAEALTAAGVSMVGESSRSAESCADLATSESFLAGGSTASGATFDVQLLNPYAGEAILELTVTSDAGIESNDRFNAVRVPPLSTVTLPMSDIIPGREEISVRLEVTSGSALAVARQAIEGRTAIWRAVEPAQEWWLPIPEGGGTKQLVLGTPASAEVQYQIDYYGPDGLQEEFETGVLEARGRQRVGLAAISPDTAGMHIISTGPVVPTLWIDSAQGLAMTTASPVEASAWLLPGATRPDGGTGRLVVLNPGDDDVSVDVVTLRSQTTSRQFDVPGQDVVEEILTPADGYRVEASGPVVVLWTSSVDGAGTAAMGIPIQDG